MDARHVAVLTRALTSSATRRLLFTGLSSALLAVFPLALSEEAAAKRKQRRKKRRKRKCPSGATGKYNGVCVQHCASFEDCAAEDFCGQPYDAEAGTRICGAYEEPFCRTLPDDVTCGSHADCDPGQLCVFTACLAICVTPTFS